MSISRPYWPCYFYPRSPCGERPTMTKENQDKIKISIHALLAESDRLAQGVVRPQHHFYPRSPCGERPRAGTRLTSRASFLSTLSLRRATLPGGDRPRHTGISIHALLAESDSVPGFSQRFVRISIHALLRRATSLGPGLVCWHIISIHALLAESDSRIDPDQVPG